jgi:23S rRNA (adenine1618-N6)-methyltransferase
MIPKKKSSKKEISKPGLHPRNRHSGRYEFASLINGLPELAPFVKENEYGVETIDFFDPKAVKTLNKALLKEFYNIDNWDIPAGYLCPPVPGRAEYVHHVADLIKNHNFGTIPSGNEFKVLDLGTGANGIYSIIANREYGWSSVGSDIDEKALHNAGEIYKSNPKLGENISVRHQENSKNTFRGIIQLGEKFDVSICNPPFHSSIEESQKGSMRKLRNLKGTKVTKLVKNFEGMSNELWCEGGELKFIQDMIMQSREFSTQVYWFTTLVSKQTHLRAILKLLREVKAVKTQTIEMGHGNKLSRIVAWTFLDKREQQEWRGERWGSF